VKKILLIFGSRPEAVKLCPLIRELKSRPGFQVRVCVTGQHRQLLDSVLESFGVVPDWDLSVMQSQQTLADLNQRVLQGLQPVLEAEKPDLVLVQGDTTTAFAGALASFYRKLPVGHIEAGLRTFDVYSPYPEEFNRRAISLMAQVHFAPTETARDNLLREGVPAGQIYVTGNTGVDALRQSVREDFSHPVLDWAGENKLVVLTLHRRENWGQPMENALRAVRRVLAENASVRVFSPVHPNPVVSRVIRAHLGDDPHVLLTEPLSIQQFHNVLARCALVLTDSGGIQEETTALGKPTLVLRNTTERPEGLSAGVLELTGLEEESVYRAFSQLLQREDTCLPQDTFGDGNASRRIADILEKL
jgi:UDP-N-acetylglucosamine 2-epimerase (non-hydrolysing)